MKIKVEGVSYRIPGRTLIDAIDLEIQEGELVGLIGPNGSGKTTLLKNMYRVLEPVSGQIWINGDELRRMPHKATARLIGVVGQETPVAFDFSVRDIVTMGRNPHKRWFEGENEADGAAIEDALERVGLLAEAERSFLTLSGGEKQRALIARTLAQQARFIILDEPTNHLDIRHQLQTMELIKELKLASLAALHDLNIAAMYCDRIVVMKEGRITACGTPEAVLRPALLLDVFGVAADIVKHPLTGKPSITFLPTGPGRSGQPAG